MRLPVLLNEGCQFSIGQEAVALLDFIAVVRGFGYFAGGIMPQKWHHRLHLLQRIVHHFGSIKHLGERWIMLLRPFVVGVHSDQDGQFGFRAQTQSTVTTAKASIEEQASSVAFVIGICHKFNIVLASGKGRVPAKSADW